MSHTSNRLSMTFCCTEATSCNSFSSSLLFPHLFPLISESFHLLLLSDDSTFSSSSSIETIGGIIS